MSFFHGIRFSEQTTSVQAAATVNQSLTIAVGTASKQIEKPQLIYNLSDYQKTFGSGTLDEVADVFFNAYSASPVVFINVLDKEKHFTEKVTEIEDATQFKIIGNIDSDTIKITTGEKIDPVELIADEDFAVRVDEVEDFDEGTTDTSITFHLLSDDNLNDGKVSITYRTLETALGGEAIQTEITLAEGGVFELPSNTVVESVTASSVGINTLRDVGFAVDAAENETTITLFLGVQLVDGKVKVYYNEIDTSKVTGEDIIQALDKIDSTYARFTLTPGIIIAPGFSTDTAVSAAMAAKAKSLDCIAINDILADSYTAAIEYKNTHGLSHSHLITCYPKVTLGGVNYYLSTHLAALMNVTDSDNDDIPYVSPSNKNLQIDGAVINGKEIYLTQEQANLLNAAGIVTAFNYGGWKAWGNLTSVGETGDYKDKFISVRRMVNFVKWYFVLTYFTNLAQPINTRQIESILQSANIYLATLTARGVLLGGELIFNEEDNPQTSLINGELNFQLRILPPPPTQEINITLQINPDYFSNLFA